MVRGFVLGMVLLGAIGVCIVQETNKQTQARYRLKELTRQEEEAKKRLSRLHSEEQALRSPARLARLVREKRLALFVLGSGAPAVAQGKDARRPGQVLEDVPGMGDETDMELASVGGW